MQQVKGECHPLMLMSGIVLWSLATVRAVGGVEVKVVGTDSSAGIW